VALHGVSEHVTIVTTVQPGNGVEAESNLGMRLRDLTVAA